jgi:hypothetical protein
MIRRVYLRKDGAYPSGIPAMSAKRALLANSTLGRNWQKITKISKIS